MSLNYAVKHYLLLPLIALLLSSCAASQSDHHQDLSLTYIPAPLNNDLLSEFAPTFIIQDQTKEFNHIGAPTPSKKGNDQIDIDINQPTIYAETRTWQGIKENYTNLIYRIHFPEIPSTFFPFHLGSGKNIGLFLIITLNPKGEPLLYTTLHTCGCYLAFVSTTKLSADSLPQNWPDKRQNVYGEDLPAKLETISDVHDKPRLFVQLRNDTHRVMDIWLDQEKNNDLNIRRIELLPLRTLNQLTSDLGGVTSFYEETGSRKGYVKNSQKIWERLFISWWAFDWRVGEDKRLGRDMNDGPSFYTSLKPWAREDSDLRDFSAFLKYWGWRL